MFKAPNFLSSTAGIYTIAFTLSIICSIVTIHNSLINNDGIFYLTLAQEYYNNGLSSVLGMYHWPFFSIILAALSKLTGVSIINCAYTVITLLQAIIITTFIALFRKLSQQNSLMLLAVITILLFPQFNEYRHYILRDYGLWTFSLLSVLFFCNYCEQSKPNVKNIFLFYCSSLLAFLFRSEAIVLFSLLPLVIFILEFSNEDNYLTRKKLLINIYTPLIVLLLLVATIVSFFFIMSKAGITNNNYHSLYMFLHLDKIEHLIKLYSHNRDALNKNIFYMVPLGSFTSICFFAFGLFAIYVVKFISVLNVFFIIPLCVGFNLLVTRRIQDIQYNNFKIIAFAGLISAIFPLLFLYMIFITAGRYYILPALLLLLFVPFGISHIYQNLCKIFPSSKQHAVINLLGVLLSITILISGLVSFGPSKNYIKQAGLWFKQQNHSTELNFSNDSQLGFYSSTNKPLTEDKIFNTSTKFDYVLLKIKHKEHNKLNKVQELVDSKKIVMLKRFSNKRGDQVLILQKNS